MSDKKQLLIDMIKDDEELGLYYSCKYIKLYGASCSLNNNCKYPNCDKI